MGIDCNGAAFLKYCSKKRPFGKTATLGRQRLVRTKQDINLLFKYPKDYDLGNWGDDKLLKKEFGPQYNKRIDQAKRLASSALGSEFLNLSD